MINFVCMKIFDVIILVLNEELILVWQVEQLYVFLKIYFFIEGQWQIVIVDNGFIDWILEIVQEFSNCILEVIFVKVFCCGVGLVLKIFWGQFKVDIVGYMDFDLAIDLLYFLEVYWVIVEEDYDVVYVFCLYFKFKVVNWLFKCEVASWVFNLMFKMYFGVGFLDGMCGFKWLKWEVYLELYEVGV